MAKMWYTKDLLGYDERDILVWYHRTKHCTLNPLLILRWDTSQENLPKRPRRPSKFAWNSSTLGWTPPFIYFDGEYYEYHGGEREEQGLSIGGYESAFLADLVASYLFKNPRLTSARKYTTESIEMTAWYFLRVRRKQVRLKTGWKSFSKRWTQRR